MDKTKLLITIIVPVYNEAAGLSTFHQALSKVLADLPYQFEVIFVDDGSRDKSLKVLSYIAKNDRRVRILEFSKNFGKEIATTAGLHHAKGDAAIMLDADGQFPIYLIGSFIRRWEDGADVVVGLRKGTKRDSLLKRFASNAFYKLLSALAEVEITANATDFRLLDRSVIDHFNRFTERGRMTRGLIDWLGFRREFLEYQERQRKIGTASYSLVKLFKLAMNSFITNSMAPLRLAGYLGILIIAVSTPIGFFILIEKYILRDPWHLVITGPATLGVILLFLVGIILVCLGLIALYIANIHIEVTGRPLYVIRHEHNHRTSPRVPKSIVNTEPEPPASKTNKPQPAIASSTRSPKNKT